MSTVKLRNGSSGFAKVDLGRIDLVDTVQSIMDKQEVTFPKMTEAVALDKDKIYFLKIEVPMEHISSENLNIYRERMTLWANQIFIDYGISIIPFINDSRVKVEFLPQEPKSK